MSAMVTVRNLLRGIGLDVARFTPDRHPVARRRQLMHACGVDLVLDVGANTGQFATHLRRDLAYRGRIVSFEPLAAAFDALRSDAARDPAWEARRCALGDRARTARINVAGNSQSSSLLEMLPAHREAAPDSAYVGSEPIEVTTLDACFGELRAGTGGVFLKVDTQGYEAQVLEGAQDSLRDIALVQLEMSLIPLYAGAATFEELCATMREAGYRMVSLESGYADPRSGRLLQVDGLFQRC